MHSANTKVIIDLLGGYPSWAIDKREIQQINTFAYRLFELACQYQAGMVEIENTNVSAFALMGDLLKALHSNHPVTGRATIESYHVTSEFVMLLELAEQIRSGNDMRVQLYEAARDINFSRSGNASKFRGEPDHQHIIDEANQIKARSPRLSTSRIAVMVNKKYPKHKVGYIRNILSSGKIYIVAHYIGE